MVTLCCRSGTERHATRSETSQIFNASREQRRAHLVPERRVGAHFEISFLARDAVDDFRSSAVDVVDRGRPTHRDEVVRFAVLLNRAAKIGELVKSEIAVV